MKKHIWILIWVLAGMGCNKPIPVESIEISSESIKIRIDQYADSSYFSAIKMMQYDRGAVYALDVRRCDIAVLDSALQLRHTIGRSGRGPNELLMPCAFYERCDTTAVLDFGSRSIKRFAGEQVLSTDVLPNAVDCRFFWNDSLYYLPAVTEEHVFLTMQRHTADDTPPPHTYYGTLDRNVETVSGALLRNNRNLHPHPTGCYAVPEVQPYVERYDSESLVLRERLDLSETEPYKNNLAFAASKGYSEKSFYTYTSDSYLEGDRLFILCNTLGDSGGFRVNQLLEIALSPQMHIKRIYKLPGEIYDSFCVSPTYFYAFNAIESTIEAIRRPL